MKLRTFKMDSEKVVFSELFDGKFEEEERKVTCHEAPTQLVLDAIAALDYVVLQLEGRQKMDIDITGLKVIYTEAGTRSIQIDYDRTFRFVDGSEKVMSYKTPFVRIDEKQAGETGPERQISTQACGVAATAIDHACSYATGEGRQQMTFRSFNSQPPEPDPEEDLGLGDEEVPEPEPAAAG